MDEPIFVTAQRIPKANHLAEAAINLAEDTDFCKQNCSPNNCPAKTEESIVQIHSRLIRTGALAEHLERLEETHTTLTRPAFACPNSRYHDLIDRIAEEVRRGVPPEELERIGLGNEPSPLGGTLASDMDPEEVLARKN